jgi:hypothetical protein
VRSTTDFLVENEGSIVLVTPTNKHAGAHLETHVDPDAQWLRGSLVVEHRYAPSLVEQLIDDGFSVQGAQRARPPFVRWWWLSIPGGR